MTKTKEENKVLSIVSSKLIEKIEGILRLAEEKELLLSQGLVEEANEIDVDLPWVKRWNSGKGYAYNRKSNRPYALINQILLGEPGEYGTFDYWSKEGGKIKKGSKGQIVLKYFKKTYVKKVEDENGDIAEERFSYMKPAFAKVFHISQVEGVEPKEKLEFNDNQKLQNPEEIVEKWFELSGCLFDQFDRAYPAYFPAMDRITMPFINQFETSEEYYSTVFHEMTHSTGAKKRLDRKFPELDGIHLPKRSKNEYSYEELVAEIGAANLMFLTGTETTDTFDNSAGYIKGWLTYLKDNTEYLINASRDAEKAVNYILNLAKGDGKNKPNENDCPIWHDIKDHGEFEREVVAKYFDEKIQETGHYTEFIKTHHYNRRIKLLEKWFWSKDPIEVNKLDKNGHGITSLECENGRWRCNVDFNYIGEDGNKHWHRSSWWNIERNLYELYEMHDVVGKEHIEADEMLEACLLEGTGVTKGKERVWALYRRDEEPSTKEAIDFLKNEYGIGGSGSPMHKHEYGYHGNNHDGKGLEVHWVDVNGEHKKLYKWNEVDKKYREMINSGRYYVNEI